MTEQSPWKQLSSRVVHETRWMKLKEDEVIMPSGKPGKYTYIDAPPFILVVPRNEQGQILLIRQFRYATGRQFWELTAGGIEAGESPEEAAEREPGEETGYRAASWRVIGEVYESNSLCNDRGTIFLAEELTLAPELLDGGEEGILERRWFDLTELHAMAAAGELPDAKTTAALYTLEHIG